MRFKKKRVRNPRDRIDLIEEQVQISAGGSGVGLLRQILLEEIIRHVPDRAKWGQVEAIYHWVQYHIRYLEDPIGLDFYPTAAVLLAIGGGDCDDHTILICALCAVIGLEVGARLIETLDGQWHIYPIVHLDGQWVPLDTTAEGIQAPGVEWPPQQTQFRESYLFEL